MLFIVIAAKMLVHAVIRAKRGTEPDLHKLLPNYQIGGFKLTPILPRSELKNQIVYAYHPFIYELTKNYINSSVTTNL